MSDKKTLFVAICRTLGIPARLNPASREAEYYKGSSFHPAAGEQQEGQMRLVLTSQGRPEYYASWTLGRLIRESRPKEKDGGYSERFETLDLSGREFYKPSGNGYEAKIRAHMARIKKEAE